MKLLKEIKDNEFRGKENYTTKREASRAILFDNEGYIPLIFVSKYNFHKLPGGGIDIDESKEDALKRECLEEVGAKIKINGKVGKIIEYRTIFDTKQISYCYYGDILSKGKPDFCDNEKAEGCQIIWLNLNDAIIQIKNDKPENYRGCLIQKRDLIFLTKFKDDLNNNSF